LSAHHASSHSGYVGVTAVTIFPQGVAGQIRAEVSVGQLPIGQRADVHCQVIVPEMQIESF